MIMESDKKNRFIPQPIITMSEADTSSIDSLSGDETENIDAIRTFLSPLHSDPNHLDPNSNISEERFARISTDDFDHDILMESLKSASFLNSNSNLSQPGMKRYTDNLNDIERDHDAQPFIFHPDRSMNSFFQSSSSLLHTSNNKGAQVRRRNSTTSVPESITESIVNSIMHLKELTLLQIRRRRFILVSIFSIICMLIFNLIFLPRTTFDRDLRRLYMGNDYLTVDDISRLFITQLTKNSKIDDYFSRFDKIKHNPSENLQNLNLFLQDFTKLKIDIEEHEVLLSEPISASVELLDTNNNTIFRSSFSDEPLFYPYSRHATVESNFVYLNYGLEDDYELLKNNNIETVGLIFIIRLKDYHPSLLIAKAQTHGAKAIIFYEDPFDDGKFTELNGFKEFPAGKSRNHNAIDKFTLNDIYSRPGDPRSSSNMPTIPVIPMCYKELERILETIDNGPDFRWSGNLEKFAYVPGPSTTKVLLKNEVKNEVKAIHNIIITIPGLIPNEDIILGASNDVIGGLGGFSKGEISMFEIARGFNELVEKGWKPLRTVKLIIWDGSSLGQLGSTAFGDVNVADLVRSCLVYINLNDIRGTEFSVESNPLMNDIIQQTMDLIIVDSDKTTLHEQFKKENNSISLLQGVGDFSVFQNHIGIPSINVGFKNDKKKDPVTYYNSKFDNLDLLKSFDPHLEQHSLLAQFIGMLVLQLSENEIPCIKITDYVQTIHEAFHDFSVPKEWIDEKMEYQQQLLPIGDLVEAIGVKLDEILQLSETFQQEISSLQNEVKMDYPWFKLFKKVKLGFQIKRLNSKIKSIDKLFVSTNSRSDILENRSWFRHLLFAPNASSNPATTTVLPGLKESVEYGLFAQFVANLSALKLSLDRLSLALALAHPV